MLIVLLIQMIFKWIYILEDILFAVKLINVHIFIMINIYYLFIFFLLKNKFLSLLNYIFKMSVV